MGLSLTLSSTLKRAASPKVTIRPHASTQRIEGVQAESPPHIELGTVVDMFLERHRNAPENQQDFRDGWLTPSSGLVEDERLEHCYRLYVFQLIHAARSATKLPPIVHKITDAGTARHASLDAMFAEISKAKFASITETKSGKEFGLMRHATLPLQGEFDMFMRMQTWSYILEFKTKGVATFDAIETVNGNEIPKSHTPPTKQQLAAAEAENFKNRVQLNTYLGLAGIKAGYLVYEQNNTKAWPKSLAPYRVDFDEELFRRVEEFVTAMVAWVQAETVPPFDAGQCKAHVDGCPYRDSCARELNGAPFAQLDKRPAETKQRHLQVVC